MVTHVTHSFECSNKIWDQNEVMNFNQNEIIITEFIWVKTEQKRQMNLW